MNSANKLYTAENLPLDIEMELTRATGHRSRPSRLTIGDRDLAITTALRSAVMPGYYDVIVHGSPTHIVVLWTPSDLAFFLRRQHDYVGQPIRLISCKTGQDDEGFAQCLADEMKVPVFAANKNVRPHNDGRLTIDDNGIWKLFDPR